jgi:hypothetical protein
LLNDETVTRVVFDGKFLQNHVCIPGKEISEGVMVGATRSAIEEQKPARGIRNVESLLFRLTKPNRQNALAVTVGGVVLE